MAFRILTICTGNICRSPTAERLLSAALTDFVSPEEVIVQSAGTGALIGAPMEPQSAQPLRKVGVDTSGFAARQLAATMVREADLVLGMTRVHRSAAVQMWPAALKRTFTLPEFARLAARIDPEELVAAAGSDASAPDRLRALVELAPLQRTPVVPEFDDVPDPYGRESEAFQTAYAQITRAVDDIVATLDSRRV